jgi:hypothetical protein
MTCSIAVGSSGTANTRWNRPLALPSSRSTSTIDEAEALSLVILGPVTPHVGRGVGKSAATEAVTDTLMRCRSAQRRFRNTLLFVAADETQLSTAREAMRRALAWESIGGDPRQDKRVDKRLQDQMTQAQLADARDKARNNREGAARAVRAAWSHVIFPVESTEPGKPFDPDHLAITARKRTSVPAAVYEKASAKGDGIIKETLDGETLATRLTELWPADRPHLPVAGSPSGSRPMSICRNCAIGSCWRPQFATHSPSSTRNSPMQTVSTRHLVWCLV